jgi:dUTP pyrophosphatase
MKFEVVRDDCRKFPKDTIILPTRKTENSAGYDFYSNESAFVKPNEMHIFWTDVKVELDTDKYLQCSVRSSLAIQGLILANGVGIVDSDYYSNESNDGNIGIMLRNLGNNYVKIAKGDRIAQGVILKYHTIEEQLVKKMNVRIGGLGSTGR